MPSALVGRWSRRWGQEEAFRLSRLALAETPLSLRLGTELRAPDMPLTEELAILKPRPTAHPSVLLLPASASEALFASGAFAAGQVSIQGETALRAAELMGAAPGERLLDLCAAPGGKTAVLAEAGAQVLALDRSPARLAPLLQNMARLGLTERVTAIAGDGTASLSASGAPPFDGVLVDAPCTNSGVLAQRPGARWRFGPKSEADLNAIQDRLLSEAAAIVRPGGRLVYSTCSLEPAENAQRVRAFLEAHPTWTLAEEFNVRPGLPASGGSADSATAPAADGGYGARLVRA